MCTDLGNANTDLTNKARESPTFAHTNRSSFTSTAVQVLRD
jgi:hypothetical protein